MNHPFNCDAILMLCFAKCCDAIFLILFYHIFIFNRNDLMGLEGMVKLKNPDEVVVVTTLNTSESHADLNNSTISQGDSEKR